MIREVITANTVSIKLGLAESQISSVRSQVEEETAVRVFDGGCAGLASAVGVANIEDLTRQAKAGLGFEIAYPAVPEKDRRLEASHLGRERTVDELVGLTQSVLTALTSAFPQYVFSDGLEQTRVGWRISNDLGLDLRYERVSTQASFVIKEKGSGSIFDTFVVSEGLDLQPEALIESVSSHLRAFGTPAGEVPTGRQRVVFPGLEGHAGGGILQLLRTDMVARAVATGSSVFGPNLGTPEKVFSEQLTVHDTRDASKWRVSPFDMEGVVRASPDLPLVQDGVLGTPVASKRDAVRYDMTSTGSAVGGLAQLPATGVGKLVLRPTAERLVDLLDGQAALMPWFVAGGDCTRAGDLGMPVQVLLRVEPDGTVSGSYPGCTMRGNLYQVLGEDLIGITAERIDPNSEEPYLMTHMTVTT